MLPYWLLFALFTAGALFERPQQDVRARRAYPLLAVGAAIIALMIGFRFEVGGDWEAYLQIFSYAGWADLEDVLARGDQGYHGLNWLVQQIGGEIWLVNLAGGLVFAWGLFNFARTQRSPWLAVLVAIPYLVTVVAMGYSRQAMAIGVLMAGLAAQLRGGSTLKFAAYVLVAALFHSTAVVVFPLVALASRRSGFHNLLIAVAGAVLLYDLFLAQSVETFMRVYLDRAYASEGAAIRIGMSLVPALLFLANPRRFGFAEEERLVWRNFSFAAVGLSVLLLVLPSSTAVDRIALYIIPLQLAVLSRLPDTYLARRFGTVLVILYSFMVQYIWLNFAAHARYWVPYTFYPL